MIERFGSDPANMIVQLSPCIRPPHYEVDFAAEIIRQCRALGVQHIHDSGMCTACDLGRTAEQVHGNEIAVIDKVGSALRADRGRRGAASLPGPEFPACDGIITNQRSVALGIYVADCCAVYIVDPRTPAIGLVHSGRKGTELGVVTNAIRQMIERFGSDPANMIVQLSPCIRPPHYEVDFAAEIIRQCRALDVQHIHDSGACTACDLGRYYSYRAEKGKTGRMLAVLGLDPTIPN